MTKYKFVSQELRSEPEGNVQKARKGEKTPISDSYKAEGKH